MSRDPGVYEAELARFELDVATLQRYARALAVLLFDARGMVLAVADVSGELDVESIGRLVEAQLATPQSVANMVGADAPVLVGDSSASVHASLVADRAVLLVLHGDGSSSGWVKLRVERALPELLRTFDAIRLRAGSTSAFDHAFPPIPVPDSDSAARSDSS